MLKPNNPEMTMGVGDGTGNLFVHGSAEAIFKLQKMIFRLEYLERLVKDIRREQEAEEEYYNTEPGLR